MLTFLQNSGFGSFIAENMQTFWTFTGFHNATPGHLAMIVVGLVFLYFGIAKKWEPMLLVPIGFGILVGNIPFFPGLGIGIYEEGSVL
ncbi:MAG: sodium ion-translocating decarboxylase subunit beta, partial [Alistipes sp.]|nr:sodium ion-translocating decarboxylase subunit beta [Alistipes sp.]